jgi:gliding motility-associated-like protein
VDSIKLGPIKVTPVEEAFIPSAFTPNFDGINDEFYFPYLGYQTYTIEIYNRWGQLVFTNNGELNRYWKGYNMDGIRCEEGIYSYVFKGVKDNGESVKILGTVTLLR